MIILTPLQFRNEEVRDYLRVCRVEVKITHNIFEFLKLSLKSIDSITTEIYVEYEEEQLAKKRRGLWEESYSRMYEFSRILHSHYPSTNYKEKESFSVPQGCYKELPPL